MKYKIVYDTPGRLRLRCGSNAFSKDREQGLEMYLTNIPGVFSAVASSVNGGILVYYDEGAREDILSAVGSVRACDIAPLPPSAMQIIDEEFKNDFIGIIKRRILSKFFLPSFIRIPLTIYRALPFIKEGIKSLSAGKLNVSVLDAVSISASIASGSYSTAASVMTLLNISALLESYTRKKAKNALSDSLSINIDKVWRVKDGEEQFVPLADIAIGDIVRVRSGSMIPIDGSAVGGDAEVNEASMTGESIPIEKTCGMSVYAGTVVESGTIDIEVKKLADDSRIHNIIELIENSEELKSSAQTRAEKYADRLVPLCFITSIATFLLTHNVSKALSVLMVDYSCAIKLSTPVCVISAMREATNYDIMIKGGRFLENYALADSAVFDKTGTLTVSCPKLSRVIAFDSYSEDEVLTIAACLEEHFPHSVAKAIVSEAANHGLEHSEMHAEVKYIVAHGIASDLNGKRALIGSAHFIFDDEKIEISDEQKAMISELGEKYSMIYLAIGEQLCGILCIEDPIRENAAEVIAQLKERGFDNIMMITGDGESTAQNVCGELGIEKFYARVLPDDKLNIVNEIKADGHKVVMIGDGINDSPALAAADVSIAMKDASDIAREVADITLLTSDLSRLIVLRDLSEKLFARLHANYRFITLFNTSLIALGMCGVISPVTSALLHNISTMGVVVQSMRRFLPERDSL